MHLGVQKEDFICGVKFLYFSPLFKIDQSEMLRRAPTKITLTQQDLLDFSKELNNKNSERDVVDKSLDSNTPYNAIEANEKRRQQQTMEQRLGI